jgi:hypothetical protein
LASLVTTDHKWVALADDIIGAYNSWDTYATAGLAKVLPTLLPPDQLAFYHREVRSNLPAILAMMERGLPVDLAAKERIRRSLRSEVRTADRYLYPYANHFYQDPYAPRKGVFNTNSDTQVRRWLFGGDRKVAPIGDPVEVVKGVVVKCLGLKPAGKTDEGLWSVDQDNLTRVLRDLRKMDEPHRVAVLALLHRSRSNKLDEYLDFDWEDRGQGPRIYPTIKPHGTKSLRFAYSDPALHSWSKEIRGTISCREGWTLVKADFSQIEARLAAYLSGDQLDIAIYERKDKPPHPRHPGWDIHSALACDGLDLSADEWLAMDEDQRELMRDSSKGLRYGTLLYGGQPETAKTKVTCPCGNYEAALPWTKCVVNKVAELPTHQKRRLVDGWMFKHRAFVEWRAKLMEPFQGPHATYKLRMPTGWVVQFCTPASRGGELEREVYNRPMQHTATIIKLRALRRLHELGVPIIFDHHDALMGEVREGEAEATAQLMREVMEESVPELGGVRFPVEVVIGTSWGALH